VLTELTAADEQAVALGATIRGEMLLEHKLQRAMDIAEEHQSEAVMTATVVLLAAMRDDAADGPSLATPRGVSIRRPGWLGGERRS
jgi:hypothetical protein